MFSSITRIGNSSQSSSEKSLPALPRPVQSKKSNNTSQSTGWQKTKTTCLTPYYKWSEWLEKKHPKVAPYKFAILISLGLFLLAILIIIIVAAAGGFQNNDTGATGLAMSGSGDGTYYDPGVGLGSCGWQNYDSELVAAMNAPQYGIFADPGNSPVCGKCIQVTGPKGTVKVKVVDKCPVCKSGDIDMSSTAFKKIANLDDGRVKITWKGC
ncbi:7860_t:CDS:2 [Gigaspora margarita]|uniref:Barwin-like endoglucanase n=2 Tax=Gigaspora margarita TaxID=4874 RepID=A0A8H4B284_GIGMA|nr:barwin-like endoglucanase [Gigaspora margarita]CAG8525475.1 7860_t:CDS:2 [Gigaspora margarita]